MLVAAVAAASWTVTALPSTTGDGDRPFQGVAVAEEQPLETASSHTGYRVIDLDGPVSSTTSTVTVSPSTTGGGDG